MVCALGGGIKLLVLLCPVIYQLQLKHKVTLKQTQALCWESRMSQCLGFSVCLGMVRYRTCISDITIA